MSGMGVSKLTIAKMKELFAEGKRFDGRGLLDWRELHISQDVSNKAEGSARVKLGNTEVIVGIKMVIGTPYTDSPDKGNLSVSADLLPMASPRFEQGPPKFNAVELPRLVDRAIRECHMIDLSQLVVEAGEKVWTVMVDVYPINDDGNLIDAAVLGAVVALKNTFIPELDKDGKIDYHKKSKKPLPLHKDIAPISMTFFKLGNHIIMDPTREEEESCETKLNIGASYLDGSARINSAQKSGGGKVTLSEEELEKIAAIVPKKLEELTKRLKKFL